MDRYQKVEKPKPESPINENEIRITTQGAIRNYITYATTLLQVLFFFFFFWWIAIVSFIDGFFYQNVVTIWYQMFSNCCSIVILLWWALVDYCDGSVSLTDWFLWLIGVVDFSYHLLTYFGCYISLLFWKVFVDFCDNSLPKLRCSFLLLFIEGVI